MTRSVANEAAAGTPARQGGAGRRIVFADLGRAIGALLVVYSHISVLWMPEHHYAPGFMTPLDLFGRYALRLENQDIGEIAVPMFFLVSGFVVTQVGLAEGPARFAVKRLLRVYPVLIATVLITALVVVLGLHPLWTDGPAPVTVGTVLTNLSLANFVMVPQYTLVGVAWTLGVEVLFYLLLLVLMPLVRRLTWYAICVELTFVTVVVAASRSLGANFFLFSVCTSFLPIILIGQIIWAVHSGRVRLPLGFALGVVAWLEYVWADWLGLGRQNNAYNLALAYAVLLFGIGLMVERRLRSRQWITFLSERSYEIYLLHGAVLFPALDLLTRWVPFLVALPVGLLIMMGVVEVVYQVVDRPARRLGGMLARRLPGPRKPARRPAPVRPRADPGADPDAATAVETTVVLPVVPPAVPPPVRGPRHPQPGARSGRHHRPDGSPAAQRRSTLPG